MSSGRIPINKVTNDQAQIYDVYKSFSKKWKPKKLSETLEKADSSDDSYIKKSGAKISLFPRLPSSLKPMSLTIKTNINQVDVLLNEKK